MNKTIHLCIYILLFLSVLMLEPITPGGYCVTFAVLMVLLGAFHVTNPLAAGNQVRGSHLFVAITCIGFAAFLPLLYLAGQPVAALAVLIQSIACLGASIISKRSEGNEVAAHSPRPA